MALTKEETWVLGHLEAAEQDLRMANGIYQDRIPLTAESAFQEEMLGDVFDAIKALRERMYIVNQYPNLRRKDEEE